MPFESESLTSSSLTVNAYSNKNLFLRIFIYFLFAYPFIDLMVGLMAFLNRSNNHLLIKLDPLFANFGITPESLRLEDPFYLLMVGMLFICLIIIFVFMFKFAESLGLLIPPPKKHWGIFPYRAIISKQGVESFTKDKGTEKRELLVWNKNIYSVFVKMETNYRVRLYFIQKPNVKKTITEYDEEYYSFSRDEVCHVELGRMFLSVRDRKRALGFLKKYLKHNLPEYYLDEAYFN